jgi:hypothetical protein
MDSISTFTGKLLFFIRGMEKDALITKKDKGLLKGTSFLIQTFSLTDPTVWLPFLEII